MYLSRTWNRRETNWENERESQEVGQRKTRRVSMAKALECLLKLIAMYNEYMSLSTLFKRRQRSQLTEGERGNYSLTINSPGSQDPRTPLLP